MKRINTEFFRNPEIKKDMNLYVILTLLSIIIGFFIPSIRRFILMVYTITVILLHFVSTYKRYEKLRKLSLDIDHILHQQRHVDFEEYKEGELSILANEINKMVLCLKEQRDALDKDKTYLTDSIADISHQLKTPLTSINLLLSFLDKPELHKEQRENHIKELKRLINRIDWLISTLLKLSKLDAGTAYFKNDRVDIKDLISLSLESIIIPMELKEQELTVLIEDNSVYLGDMAWSQEAISNILKNCMEHTPYGGKIKIHGSNNSIFVQIVIEDTGKGIANEDLPHIFERFYKGKHSSTESIGIGLPLARKIITEQNGTIKVENTKNSGAKFVIRFYKMVY